MSDMGLLSSTEIEIFKDSTLQTEAAFSGQRRTATAQRSCSTKLRPERAKASDPIPATSESLLTFCETPYAFFTARCLDFSLDDASRRRRLEKMIEPERVIQRSGSRLRFSHGQFLTEIV